MAMEVVQEEIGDGNMQCTNHPYKNSAPGGICAFCLQEKLGKLVSSSFSVAFLPSSSSSSSPSFRSELGGGGASAFQARRIAASSSSSSVNSHQVKGNDCAYNGYSSSSSYNIRRSRLPFVLTQKKKTKKDGAMAGAGADSGSIVFKRSKSTATPRRGGIMHFMDARNYSTNEDNNSRRRFWSFLYMSNSNSKQQQQHSGSGKKSDYTHSKESNFTSSTRGVAAIPSREKSFVVVEENESPDEAAFDRKVSRSRSVGCGSRSFSGDLFERISNGFGDCTLRRVESQREGKVKPPHSSNRNGNGSSASSSSSQDCIKERVRCGGIFSGFIITSSSSSSSSSSYLVSEENNNNVNGNGKASSSTITSVKNVSHGRSRSWGWALASPIRALGKTSSGKRAAAAAAAAGVASNKNPTPNLAAIPSLLTVSG